MEEKRSYFRSMSESLKSPRDLFKVINSLTVPFTSDPPDLSQELCDKNLGFFLLKNQSHLFGS